MFLQPGLHLGLRHKNLCQIRVCRRGNYPTSERRVEDMRCGEQRWSDRDHGREVFAPSVAFKNSGSFFGRKPFRLILPDLLDLYEYLDAHIDRHRGVLLGGAKDPGTLFVKTVILAMRRDRGRDRSCWRFLLQQPKPWHSTLQYPEWLLADALQDHLVRAPRTQN